MKVKLRVKALILALFSFICFGCERCERKKTDDFREVSNQKEIVVGTFNIEWLGDGVNDRIDRTEEDYKTIAEIIKEADCDIVGLQEIENASALERVVRYLPNYSFVISNDDAPQKVAVLFRKTVRVKFICDYSPLEIVDRRTRPGLVTAVQKGDFDFLVLVAHFKATSRFDDTPEKLEESRVLRIRQAEIASAWADSILQHKNELDVFIIGDLNDTPRRVKFNTMYPLSDNPNLIFLTESLKSCRYENAYVIDHIVVSKSASERLIPNSVSVYNFYRTLSKEKAEKVSDHCLVFARFDILAPDNDPSKYFVDGKVAFR
ncbi:MAG: endonuclease/exonuclease/phosphatase family protein [Ignavibacteria bacterium]|nr:endonuclease/exonuclease/phosphatase family protein [Ignavibacteria bacterium]